MVGVFKKRVEKNLVIFSFFTIWVALTSCGGPTPVKTPETPFRTYNSPFDQVYDASVKAFQNLGLDLFKQQKDQGYVEGGRTAGIGRGSEYVGIFLEQIGPSETKVSIDNRKALVGIVFAVDWTDQLFEQIEQELK